MNFKDQFVQDIDIFLNSDEFAEEIVFEESGFEKRVGALVNEVMSENDASISSYFTMAKTDILNITKNSTILYDGVKYGVVSWADSSGITDVLVQRI